MSFANNSPQMRASRKAMGERIRTQRLLLGMSQTDLAKLLGVTFQQIQKYEKGTNAIRAAALDTLAKALQASPAYLLGHDNEGDSVKLIQTSGAVKMLAAFNRVTSPAARNNLIALVEQYANAPQPKIGKR